MTNAWKRRKKKKRRYKSADVSVLGRVRFMPSTTSRGASRRMRKVLWYALVVLVLAGALAAWLTLDARFYVYQIDVVGTERVSSEEVFRASGLSGIHILWVRSAEIESRITEALPVVEAADVSCNLSAKCTISVIEREPKMVWEKDGQLWAVDDEGVIFSPDEMPETDHVVRGPMPRGEDDRLSEDVHVALLELWASDTTAIQELYYKPDRGLFFVDEQGWRVILGHGSGMSERIKIAEQVMAYLKSRGLAPRFVDVRFPSAPYYSLTNEW